MVLLTLVLLLLALERISAKMKAYRNDQSVTLVTGQDARKKDRTKEKVDDYKCVTRAENLYPENFVTLMFNLLKGEMLSNFIFFNTN